ncbi:MAG: VWA domain-containing protein [Flavobacteriales bacterium]|nr:VWA domain-containing protein [Flavobacteriales bacterium]
MNIDISFAHPQLFWLLLIIPILAVHYWVYRKKRRASVSLSTLSVFENIPRTLKEKTAGIPFVLRLLAIALFIMALARPRGSVGIRDVKTEGIDIMFALDISASMLAKDFKPDRLQASKEIAVDFIKKRPDDRIGLVIFAGESFTQCPLTSDHSVLINLFSDVKTGMVQDGTAIGDGLATAVSRLKNSTSKSKVIILLTDGVNNRGNIAPVTAGEIAKTFGVRVYSIGVGTMGKALSPVAMYMDGAYQYDYIDVKIDEPTLTQISEVTGGRYFRATDNESLKDIYTEIDQMEKTLFKVKEFEHKPDRYFWVLAAGLLFLLLEFILKNTVYRGIP